jgi:hypothetical protein
MVQRVTPCTGPSRSEAVSFCYLQTSKEGRAGASLKCPEAFSIKPAFPGSFALRAQDDRACWGLKKSPPLRITVVFCVQVVVLLVL